MLQNGRSRKKKRNEQIFKKAFQRKYDESRINISTRKIVRKWKIGKKDKLKNIQRSVLHEL